MNTKIWIVLNILAIAVLIALIVYLIYKLNNISANQQTEENGEKDDLQQSPKEEQRTKNILDEIQTMLKPILENKKQEVTEQDEDLKNEIQLIERYFSLNEKIKKTQDEINIVIGDINKIKNDKKKENEKKSKIKRRQQLFKELREDEILRNLVYFDIINLVKEFEYKKMTKGIKNEKVNCYASSLFQCLNTLVTLRKYLSKENPSANSVTMTVKRILANLNEPILDTINILKDINKIMDSPVNKGSKLLNKGAMNDVADLYEAILSSLITEKNNTVAEESIFFEDGVSHGDNFKNNYIVDSFVVNKKNRENPDAKTDYLRYLTVKYADNESIQENINTMFAEDFELGPCKCKVLAITIQESAYENVEVQVPEKINFGNKTYYLRSFCVNRGGEKGHYIAMVKDKDKLVEFNDTVITQHNIDFNKKYGRVRLIFYELNDDQ